MANREKVIKHIVDCINAVDGLTNIKWVLAELDTLKDALTLLKAQEPRVFNVGDFYGEEFGYLEYMPNIPGFSNFEPNPILISDIDEENVTVIFRSASVLKLPLDKMNKNWRIWSDYPTHELLRAVKWE